MFFTGSISTAEGSALVKLGNTTVVCGVKAVSHQHSDLQNLCTKVNQFCSGGNQV